MKASLVPGRGASERLLIVVFAILVSSLLVGTIVAQRMSSRVDALSDSLTLNAMPKIEHVASLRDATLDVQLAVVDLVHGSPDERERARGVVDAHLGTLERQVRRGIATGDPALLPNDVSSALRDFEQAVARTRETVDRDPAAARSIFRSELLPAANRLGDRAMQHIERNARQGRELALQLKQTRGRVIWLSYALIAIATVVAVAGLLLLRRQSAKRLAAVGAYARDQETKARDHESKAHEMEEFAGRVAHDIRSPLSTASLATEMLDEQVQSEDAKIVIARLQRSLSRASAIIDGLLEFARAGAHPEPGARANVREVIYDLADGIAPELKHAEIELEVEPVPSIFVRCSTGVLLSLLGNLVRNAIKYMGQAQPRRISIRTSDRGGSIRIEVSDTGPGIAEAVVPRLFDPYFRVSATSALPGLGLGLPTVRKLAEGHGGKVGVSSVVGKGSTFWFELPYAGNAWEPSDIRPRPSAEVQRPE